MITPKEAVEILKDGNDEIKIIKVKDFDEDHYVIDSIVGMFSVDKNSGKLKLFNLCIPGNLDKLIASKTCEV